MPVLSLEARMDLLEKEVARLLQDRKAEAEAVKPWWEAHFGAFKDSPDYNEAMRLGAEYRRSQPSPADIDNDEILAGL